MLNRIHIDIEINKTKSEPETEAKTYIVKFLDFIDYLRQIFPFQLYHNWRIKKINKKFDKKNEKCREVHAGNLLEILIICDIILAFLAVLHYHFLIRIEVIGWLILGILTAWGIIRIGDILVYQIHAIIVTTQESTKSPKRLIALIFINYLEIIIWFAFFYQICNKLFTVVNENFSLNSISGSLYYSVVTITSLGEGSVIPNNWFALLLISVQVLIGFLITVLVIARFIPLLSEWKKKDRYCPSCGRYIDFEAKECPHCHRIFGVLFE